MSADVSETNIGRLVRQAGLPGEETRVAAARARFLRAAEEPRSSRSRGVAVAAAALLACALLYSATVMTKPPPVPKEAQEPGSAWVSIPLRGEHELLSGVLQMEKARRPTRAFRYAGRSRLPDGLCFRVRVLRSIETFDGKALTPVHAQDYLNQVALEKGAFELRWEGAKPGLLRIELQAPDNAQEIDVLARLKATEAERSWVFEGAALDDTLLPLLEPQLEEVSDLARELKDLIDRVDAACASADLYEASKKSLSAEARRLQARADGLRLAGLYPAAAREVGNIAADLAGAMAIFTWVNGAFDGPKSYYTDNQRGKTLRGDRWEFAALRRYLEEAAVIAGREFDLWMLQEFARRGAQPELVAAVERQSKRPGVAEFAEALKHPTPALADAVRRIAK